MTKRLEYRNGVAEAYHDVFTPASLEALEALASFNLARREILTTRNARRLARTRTRAHRLSRP
jgi:hypothetical protein